MTALTAAPLASLLDRLFADAEAAEPDIDAAFADLSDDEQARMLRSKTDYGELYGRMKNLPLAVSRETGALPAYWLCCSRSMARVLPCAVTAITGMLPLMPLTWQRAWERSLQNSSSVDS